jgi:hypothetical protein
VMCVIGEAIARGPTVNRQSPMSTPAALAALARARTLLGAGAGAPSDAAWLHAVSARYGTDASVSQASRDSAYARTMHALANAYPRDADAQIMAAEAMMLLSPHAYWTASGAAMPGTMQMLALLQRAQRVAPGHAGACFFQVHVMESIDGTSANCASTLARRR